MDASMEDVAGVPGIGETKVKESYDTFHESFKQLKDSAEDSSSENGVVVVGFIGKCHHDVAHFINKIIDYHVFGSGKLDAPLQFEPEKLTQGMKKWLESRKLSLYHDDMQGFVYLQYSSVNFPVAADGLFKTSLVSEPLCDEYEFADLQGLLFMFLVCHIVIFIQDGSRFDMQILKRFRVLQTAKLKIAPSVRSKNVSQPHSSFNLRTSVSSESPDKSSQAKSRMILSRKNSTSVTMPSGSQTALSPSLYIPVILFVFLDDFSETQHSRNMEETLGNSTLSNSSISTRTGSTPKGSGPVMMLSRPVVNSVGGFKKKLQSSLEAQIRFSIKKCRTLSNIESSHGGIRGGAIASSAPLFALDASKAVSVVDASSIRSGESLDFAVHLVDEVLEGKATLDSLLTGSHLQNTNKEDIASVKDFISRQSGLLRGKGGLPTNSSSASALGSGMIAAAAAAASASAVPSTSASSGNIVNVPDLPTFDMWSSYSLFILQKMFSVNSDFSCSIESGKVDKEAFVLASRENLASSDPYELAVSHMKKCSGMTTRFSTWWCEKSYPLAREVYLDNLPPCYPSPQHEEHLKKALDALSSMVKGPSVPLFLKKLQDECTSIWTSGRQLCDAVSLTDKPCIHQRHDTPANGGHPHSSGYVYLHACACGRSRQLRPDPFDFENANVTYSIFSDCDQFLSSVQMPEPKCDGDVQPLSWNLVRIGSAKYYKPSKGLLQSGFCLNQKFLQSWTVNLGRLNEASRSPTLASQQLSLEGDAMSKVEIVDDAGSLSFDAAHVGTSAVNDAFEKKLRISSDINQNTSKDATVNKVMPSFTMRKPFAEVVAGPTASNSSTRILLDRKSHVGASEGGPWLQSAQAWGMEKLSNSSPNQGSGKFEDVTVVGGALKETGISNKFLPGNMNADDKIKRNISVDHSTIYVGFEYECPQGHRFILTMDHLKELGSPFWLPEDDDLVSFVENIGGMESFKLDKSHGQTNGIILSSGKAKKRGKLKPKVTNRVPLSNNSVLSAGRGVNQDQKIKIADSDTRSDFVTKHAFDGAGQALPLLNRSLPLYMNCPHCRNSSPPMSKSDLKVAGTTSQLQRVFVVTSSYPLVLALAPVIQFEFSCLPASIPNREQKLQFSLACPVILPPDSFVSLRLPFIYGVKLGDGSVLPLKPFEDQPEYTACIVKGTTLQIVSNKSNSEFPKE